MTRTNAIESSAPAGILVDLETRTTKDDHQSLRLWLRLLSCNVRIENYIRGRLRQDFDTTLPRFDLMAQLERSASGLHMSEISKRMMVSGGNITGITDQLEREGLVTRTMDAADRRAVIVRLTESGLRRFREMAAQHEVWIVDLLEGLSHEEKDTLLALLKKLKGHLNTAIPAAAPAAASPYRRK